MKGRRPGVDVDALLEERRGLIEGWKHLQMSPGPNDARRLSEIDAALREIGIEVDE